jgi:hypothetical protein
LGWNFRTSILRHLKIEVPSAVKVKNIVKLSLKQAVEAHRDMELGGSHMF